MTGADSKGHVHFDALDAEAEEQRSARGQEHRKEVVVSQKCHFDGGNHVVDNLSRHYFTLIMRSVASSGMRKAKKPLKVRTGWRSIVHHLCSILLLNHLTSRFGHVVVQMKDGYDFIKNLKNFEALSQHSQGTNKAIMIFCIVY
jgi:hypothetical protein